MVRFLKNHPTSHNSSAEAIITVKSRLLMPPIGKGEIVALHPNTKNILNRLLPITFPMAIPGFFAHGKNSGENYATSFSNAVGSYKSSLGFYLTGSTYRGKNGYSLLLDGLEKGINDCARERAIVVHGAAYANPSVCRGGRLGRSFGCPALPQALTKPIINTIKGGSVLFIYANNKEYMAKSTILPSLQPQELFSETRKTTNRASSF